MGEKGLENQFPRLYITFVTQYVYVTIIEIVAKASRNALPHLTGTAAQMKMYVVSCDYRITLRPLLM